jgi:Protein of unknown function (DUF3040).
MALSEHEQKLLEEMERSLYQNEADVVSTADLGRRAPNYTAIGIGTRGRGDRSHRDDFGRCKASLTVAGIIGFVVLFGGVMAALSILGKAHQPVSLGRKDRLARRAVR